MYTNSVMTDENTLGFTIANMTDAPLLSGWNVTNSNTESPSSPLIICLLSIVFVFIGVIGVGGNVLVGAAIVGDTRMLRSPTNTLILNLAVADLIILLACVPDIIQFIGNQGWRLSLELCKVMRFTEVFCLYASVMTLVTLCVERYVAIVHPIHAHLLCSRGRILTAVTFIWPLSMVCASPNLYFHIILHLGPNFTPCVMHLPHQMAFKYAESIVFYFVPLVIQMALYIRIGLCLFRGGTALEEGSSRHDSLLRARRGVVKMLVAGVTVYFVSFSPHQVLLLHNTMSSTPFRETWSYLILVNLMAYTSSACNPLLYSAFSHKFRRKFRQLLRPTQRLPSGAMVVATAKSNSPSSCFGGCRSKTLYGRSVKTTVTEI